MATNALHSGSKDNVPPFIPIEKQSHIADHYVDVIHDCFYDATNYSLEELRIWHNRYKTADEDLRLADALVQEVKSDGLDVSSIEKSVVELTKLVTVTNRFCSDCQTLFDHWPDLGDPDSLDPRTKRSWPGLGAGWKHTIARRVHTLVIEAAARNGCRFCGLMLHALIDFEALDVFRRIEARLQMLGDKGTSSLSVQNWGKNVKQLMWLNFPGRVCSHCNRGVAQDVEFESTALTLSNATYDQSKDRLDIAKDWLNRCSKTHRRCNKAVDGPLPTRLVHIADKNLRVVLTSGWSNKPRYSTLSYCWGDGNFLKLTQHTYEQFLVAIPSENLPKTIADSIQITQKLGLEYIWVDSLCILQESKGDWHREVGLMSSVYGGSFINIAAASATNTSEGCFLKPRHLVDGFRTIVNVNGEKFVQEIRRMNTYDMSTTSSHLATRAWTVQEKILPPRTIHFGNRGAYWECVTSTASEFLPDGFSDSLGVQLNDEKYRRKYYRSWWQDFVCLVTSTKLTHSRDRLPAISGVAQRRHAERGGTYLAGMWLDTIEEQLCWHVGYPEFSQAVHSRKRFLWRAPSWSWASVDGIVTYTVMQKDFLNERYAHVLGAKMNLAGENPFGEVLGGSLRVACSGIVDVYLTDTQTVEYRTTEGDSDNTISFPISLDCIDDESEKNAGLVYLLPLLGGPGSGVRRIEDKDEREKDGKEAYIRVQDMIICGLLLKRADVDNGEFQRIGRFKFSKEMVVSSTRQFSLPRKNTDHYDEMLQILEKKGASVAETVCKQVIENTGFPLERFVISIT